MSSRWQEAFTRLKDYTRANPGIIISDVVVSIPGEVRPEFYRLFDEVRTTFVQEMFPDALKEAEILGENYRGVEQEVKEHLKLEGIYNLGFLDRYLREPTNELSRELFDLTFALLKGRISPEHFEKTGIKNIELVIATSHRLGYAKWVALSLVKQLDADKVFAVTPPESKLDGHGEPLCCEMAVAFPEEIKYLTLEPGPDHKPPFITPNFIIHSVKLNKYVAFRSEMLKGEYISLNASEQREWYQIASMAAEFKDALTNPSIIMFVSEALEDLALIADKDRFNRPDMIVDIREPGDWADTDTPAAAKLYDILNPTLGRYIISREPLPEKLSQQPPAETAVTLDRADAHKEAVLKPAAADVITEETGDKIFAVGFDQAKLQLVIDGFKGREIDKIAGQGAV